MKPTRRQVAIAGPAFAALAAGKGANAATSAAGPMYGLISQFTTAPGKRDELAGILLAGTTAMPGCLAYVVAADPAATVGGWPCRGEPCGA